MLATLKEDVSPRSLQLAVNKLASHARQDVHAALKAMLGGHADAVATLVHTDHLDFARAELKEIAAKVSARVMDTTRHNARSMFSLALLQALFRFQPRRRRSHMNSSTRSVNGSVPPSASRLTSPHLVPQSQ